MIKQPVILRVCIMYTASFIFIGCTDASSGSLLHVEDGEVTEKNLLFVSTSEKMETSYVDIRFSPLSTLDGNSYTLQVSTDNSAWTTYQRYGMNYETTSSDQDNFSLKTSMFASDQWRPLIQQSLHFSISSIWMSPCPTSAPWHLMQAMVLGHRSL